MKDIEEVIAERDEALLQLENITADRDFEKKMKAKARIQRDVQTAKAADLQQRLTAADERADVLERDKVRIDWLAEQPVDTLYLDDGRIIDIAGRVDLRDAIDAAMTAPRTAEGSVDD